MITNATVTSITPPAAPDKWGKQTYASAATIAAPACLAEVTTSQRITLTATIANATAVLYLLKGDLPAGTPAPAKDFRVTVRRDGDDADQAYAVEHVVDWVKEGGLSHWQCFLREAA